jgi:hypothetical protein
VLCDPSFAAVMRADVTKKLVLNAPLATALRPTRTSEKVELFGRVVYCRLTYGAS